MTYKDLYQAKKCLYFDGVSYLELDNPGAGIANANPTDTDAWSLSMWFVYDSTAAMTLFSARYYDGGLKGWTVKTSSYKLRAQANSMYIQSFGYLTSFYGGPMFHHFAMTSDGSGNMSGVKMYLDGYENVQGSHYDGAIGAIANTDKIYIGQEQTGNGSYGSRAVGVISNVSMWSKELSGAEVQEVYLGRQGARGPGDLNRHSASSSLKAWWIADHPDDTWDGTIYDKSSNSYNMTPVGTASTDLAPGTP